MKIFHCVRQKPFLLLHIFLSNCLFSSSRYPTVVISGEEGFDFGLESSSEPVCEFSFIGNLTSHNPPLSA